MPHLKYSNQHSAFFSRTSIKDFLEHGVLATINTDDPAVEGIEIQHEYLTAAPLAGLSPEQIYTAQENGLKIAFLSEQEKDELRQKYQ